MERHGSASAAYEAFSYDARRLVGEKAYAELAKAKERGLDALSEALAGQGVAALTLKEAGYPARLRPVPDAPELLYVRGQLSERPAVAIVGSRHDTRYGRDMAFRLARDLAAAGVTVVSGLARGIDTAAHRGALAAKGRTVAVLGCGLDQVYPPDNRDLAQEIVRTGGALVSEFPLGASPLPYHFPRRNRIISGLADALLLIEAALRSGTQSTVNHALEQGRTVFALPGNVDAPGSELPIKLLKEGAELCACASDILCRLPGVAPSNNGEASPCSPAEAEQASGDPVVRALLREEKTFEELLAETGLAPGDLSARLSLLELDEVIEKRAGRAYALVQR